MDGNELAWLVRDWERSLKVGNRSPRTVQSYLESVGQLIDFAEAETVEDLDRASIEKFLIHLTETRAPATAAVRYRSLQQFTKRLVEEEELDSDPMARISAQCRAQGRSALRG